MPALSPLPDDVRSLDGFADDDLTAALACFQVSARAIVDGSPPLRPALPAVPGLVAACRHALGMGAGASGEQARTFFEGWFEPCCVTGEAGKDAAFLTGYYEPVVEGALAYSPEFKAPVLARPDDLRTFRADEPRPADVAGLSAARVQPDGTLAPYPDRASIEASLDDHRVLVWLRDWVEVFLIQVQGSAQVQLAQGGGTRRLTYAGRNGHPYTSIGRRLIDRGDIPLPAMSLDRLKAWLREQGQEPGQAGRRLMQENASYIFFSAAPSTGGVGPTGGAGVPLTALRSIAVDRTHWCYGLPFWIETQIPWQSAAPTSFHRLMIAQDTGSAIVGPARADLYCGSGTEAGRLAGDIRHRGRFVVLRPRGASA